MRVWVGSAAAKGSRASPWRPSSRAGERFVVDEVAVIRFQLDRFGDYLTPEQGTSPLTLEAYRRDVERLVAYAGVKGATLPADITSRLLRDVVDPLKDVGLAPSSIRSHISLVQSYCSCL